MGSCSSCGGTGYKECSKCSGAGSVIDRGGGGIERPFLERDPRERTCPECRGSGTVTCRDCG